MERAIFFTEDDITNQDVSVLLWNAEKFVKKFPSAFDGWYVGGLCYYKLGNVKNSLYYLSKAYQISPEAKILGLVKEMNGDVKFINSYRWGYFWDKNKGHFVIYLFTFLFVPFQVLVWFLGG